MTRVLLLDRVGGGHARARRGLTRTPRTSRSIRSSGTRPLAVVARLVNRLGGAAHPRHAALAIFWYMRMRATRTPTSREHRAARPSRGRRPSQRATLPFFLVAILLFIVQAVLGSVTGHYAVEGNELFGIEIGKLLPYAATRGWHLQLAVFWIATCWLATGLFIGPAVGGHEPKGQRALVLALLGALVVVVVGALAGTYLGVAGKLSGPNGWLVGHQGYEYIELGRVWQVGLIAGMLLWLFLVYRAIKPALRAEKDKGGLTHLLLYASVTIPLFYSVGLFYTPGTHLAIADYWRWWVVHLWVENFFEVFATVALAFILARIGAVGQKSALRATYFSILLYLGAGIVGTFHHLYFTGTPLFITSLGATFSALEIVPLTLLGFEVYENLKLARSGGNATPWQWPLYFFVAVAFWNAVGAGVLGFLINPPIVLYYAQGLNTTPIHSHGALFGVYGFLAIALMLFSMRNIVRKDAWNDRLLKVAFWGLNARPRGDDRPLAPALRHLPVRHRHRAGALVRAEPRGHRQRLHPHGDLAARRARTSSSSPARAAPRVRGEGNREATSRLRRAERPGGRRTTPPGRLAAGAAGVLRRATTTGAGRGHVPRRPGAFPRERCLASSGREGDP